MNNSLSARRQVLIKKSGRIIEHLAPNSEVVNLKCFSIEVPSFHLSFHMYPENSKPVAIIFQVPRDPLPAVRWDERDILELHYCQL